MDLILRHMETLGKRQFKEQLVSEKEDHFQIFVFLAFLFLILEYLVRRNKKIPFIKQVLPVFIFVLFTGFLDSPKSLTDKGNQLYTEKKYQSATDLYRKAKVKNPDDPAVRYNLGTVLYQTRNYQESAKELEKAIEQGKDSQLKAQALYNYGNTQYRLGNFEKAIEAYQKSLEINPKDKDAKYNLEFLQNEKSMFEKKNQERKNQKQNEKENPQQNPQQKNQQEQNQQQKQDQQQQQQQQQNQQQNQDQQQQDQNPSQGQEDQEGQSDQPEEKSENEQGNEGEQDKEQSEQQQEGQQGQEEQPQPAEEQKEEQMEPKPGEGEEQRPQGGEDQQGSAPKPLQGQMTLDNALQILDALKESERELQDLRRPPLKKDSPPVAKDW